MNVGDMVRSNVELIGVPKGTRGMIVGDYGAGVMVAWDLPPERPLPDKSPEEICAMFAIHPDCPLRDGFDKKHGLHLLEVSNEPST